MKRLAVLFTFAVLLRGDGGTVLLRDKQGPFLITVFAAPAVPKAGQVDLTVLVQDAASLAPVLDASVVIRLGPGAPIPAPREQTQNKLLYGAAIGVPTSGRWAFTVDVERQGTRASVSGTLEVAPAASAVTSHWAVLGLPPVFLLLFGIREWLIRQPRPVRAGNLD